MTKKIIKLNENDKFTNRILIVTFLIIIVASLEAFILAKSKDLLDIYLGIHPKDSPNDYLNTVIINFLINIFEPILISLYTFFTYKKYGIAPVFKFIFGGIILVRLINIGLKMNFESIFYYLLIILYIIFFILIINAPKKRKV